MRGKYLFLAFFSFFGFFCVTAQPAKPKLVVGIVVDQMRWDYLYHFSTLYSENGFKRLLKEGFTAENTMIPYVPTYTAVGHSCIYTGSIPAISGIVGNNWFDKGTGKGVYCTDDSNVTTVGANSKAGLMSPANLWVTTITDELRLSNNFKSKVIGIALKDRGAILPAGHSANAAYWYDAGKWITSSHYMKTLPAWVEKFNQDDLAGKYMSGDWNCLFPAKQYDMCTGDDQPYESAIRGEKTVTFPHKLSGISDSFKYESFKTTPFANSFTFDFAKAAVTQEQLGSNTVTDFLAISISSTDYIGHSFGPNSIEIADTYTRLDKDLAEFLKFLDARLGRGNYTVFLSADHGVAHIPEFMNRNKMPAGTFNDSDIRKELNQALDSEFGIKNLAQSVQNYQVYLNLNEVEKNGKDPVLVKRSVIRFLQAKPYIVNAFETAKLGQATLPEPQKTMLINGYNTSRSGDVQFMLKPGYFDGGRKGTTHGLWNPYDSHIPCVFFGWGVKPGKTYRETYMTDIAPTIAAMLKIQMPNGSVGKVIEELVK
ncbi:MAG: alkaline phosphatase family protein [Chitinophagaceae bacterium]|nr:alkaline phosphatase family protein [Chitinophagaceae bacterium]MBL0056212.1 alkaline phosphatase family protein [Chitinophagaceae bacterium]